MLPTVIHSLALASLASVAVAAALPEQHQQERSLLGFLDSTFDYVVVGAGTAGAAIAARLSENPDVTVALIEAGTYYQVTNIAFSVTPGADVLFAGSDPSDTNPLVDWNFVTAPQAGASGREVHYARGKCLGGR
jgi:choline dehydrogenase-like flavoprotein